MRSLALFLLIASFGHPLPAQQPATSSDDVIRINTNLVQLRVVVTDKSGKPVNNLKQEDFEVVENSQPQKISFFSLDRTASRAAEPNDQAPTRMRPETDLSTRPVGRSIVLFVDSLHTSSESLARAKKLLKQFIDEKLTSEDLVSVVASSGSLGILGQFTRDHLQLKRAIDRIARRAEPSSFYTPYLASRVLAEDPTALSVATQVMIQEEGDPLVPPPPNVVRARAQEILSYEALKRQATLGMLKAICERMAELPGQRMIALVSDGFTLLDQAGGDDKKDFEAVTSKATRTGVVIYSFSAEGLTTPPEATAQMSSALADFRNPGFANFMADSRTDKQNTLRFLAADTGGEEYLNSNDLRGKLSQMLDANQVYYAIGYYPGGDADKKFRKITVRIKDHPDYKLRTQKGYQPTSVKAEKVASTPQERLMQAMLEPLPTTTISVTSSANFLRRASDDAQVTLQVLFNAGSFEYPQQQDKYQLKCELVATFIDNNGKVAKTIAETLTTVLTAAQLQSARSRGFRYTKRVDISPGLYQVRIGVRDVNGSAMGTSSSWIEVAQSDSKRLAMSSIFLGKSNDRANAEQRSDKQAQPALVVGLASFKTNEPIFYRFVVYNRSSAGAQDLVFKLEILQEDKTIYDGGWQALARRIIREDAIGAEIGGELKMDLQPGVYTLRLTARNQKTHQSVTQTVDLELGS